VSDMLQLVVIVEEDLVAPQRQLKKHIGHSLVLHEIDELT